MYCAFGSTSYYNTGPHGQYGEPGSRSGQCDRSGFYFLNAYCFSHVPGNCVLISFNGFSERYLLR